MTLADKLEPHVHDCTKGNTCPCGFVLKIPPISFSIECFDGKTELLNDGFNCYTVDAVIDRLRHAIWKLEAMR